MDPNRDFESVINEFTKDYKDAQNPSQAVGLVKVTIVYSDKLLEKCSSRFPTESLTFKDAHITWLSKDKEIIDLVNYYWSEGAGKEPDSEIVLDRMTERMYETVLSKAQEHSTGEYRALNFYCNDYFQKLKSGDYKTNAPNAFNMVTKRIKYLKEQNN